MDFVTGFPKTMKEHESIMVIVDKLTKVSHFFPVRSAFSASDIAHVFILDVVRVYGVPKKIVLDTDLKFTSKFCKELFASLGSELAFITTYHLQMNG